MQEKRGSERRDIHVPIVCWRLEFGQRVDKPIESVCKDMSTSGACFESPRPFHVGTELDCEVHLPARKPLVSRVTVTRVESLFGSERCLLGVTFAGIDADDREAVATCLDRTNLYTILHKARKCGASDVHLAVSRPPFVRVQGRLRSLPLDPLGDGEIQAMIYPLLDRVQIQRLEEEKELDFAFSPNLRSRYRVNLHYQRGFLEATLRNVPASNPSFRELGLDPAAMEKLCQTKAGLILVAGTTGAGKTTTMASMVDWINRNQERVVVTIENPIEFTHASLKSIIKQRELGSDTLSYAQALQRSLRQDPDVIVVGELIDVDCAMAALRASETGHLVVSTVHAPDTEQAIERLVNLFPPEHASSVCRQLASCLEAVLFQMLIPGKAEQRVLASELLVGTYAVRHLIREQRFNRIPNCIQTGRDTGMYTLQSRLEELRRKGQVDETVIRDQVRREERGMFPDTRE